MPSDSTHVTRLVTCTKRRLHTVLPGATVAAYCALKVFFCTYSKRRLIIILLNIQLKYPIPWKCAKQHRLQQARSLKHFPHPLLSCSVHAAKSWPFKKDHCLKFIIEAFQFCHFERKSYRNNPDMTNQTQLHLLYQMGDILVVFAKLKKAKNQPQRPYSPSLVSFYISMVMFVSSVWCANNPTL